MPHSSACQSLHASCLYYKSRSSPLWLLQKSCKVEKRPRKEKKIESRHETKREWWIVTKRNLMTLIITGSFHSGRHRRQLSRLPTAYYWTAGYVGGGGRGGSVKYHIRPRVGEKMPLHFVIPGRRKLAYKIRTQLLENTFVVFIWPEGTFLMLIL